MVITDGYIVFYAVRSVYQMLLVSNPGGAMGSDYNDENEPLYGNAQHALSVLVYDPLAVRPAASSLCPSYQFHTVWATLSRRLNEYDTSEDFQHTLPWFWARAEMFVSVPAAPNITVSRPDQENISTCGYKRELNGRPKGMRASQGTGI
jgi:hypothetical protein